MNLEDDYVPQHETKQVLKKLLRLPLTILCHLVVQWASKYGTERDETSEQLAAKLEQLVKRRVKRRVLASKILLEYWPRGLSLFQLAQIDCYSVVYKPDHFTWTSSTAWNAMHSKQVLHINFSKFVSRLKKDLQKFYLCNIHTFEHPELPLVICRIQLFDLNKSFSDSVMKSSHIENLPEGRKLSSRAPYYVAFSLNSPNIIHSPDEDSYAQLIIQSIERTLSDREAVILKRNEIPPVRSLHSMQVLFGVSRLSNSLGSWATYGETSFEVSPFGSVQEHQSMKGKAILVEGLGDKNIVSSDDGSAEDPEIKRLRLDNSMMRFKGSKDGVKTTKLYQLKRSKNRIYSLDEANSPESQNTVNGISKYTSMVPVEKVEFTTHNNLDSDRQVSLKLKLYGNDVFAGLHELCDRRHIDINKVPGWLTGENGPSSGSIRDGNFVSDTKGGLI
ncbi:hypothetical protein HG535_0C01430 [Zygotorulaspora mrakii]|uniref:Uncharacterized protein n=1 Tax=Zygotorulaspora mrakii TaxID=42260 RepID=A0A7H9B0B8_ZYGMR|nr:uncharacterized protein HG535_0C01430 [Zygotorulaspora mrakii]QLG71794.1 hypothetical protein HG535_0C01430 [Zygotorulaspora mrakii]